MRQSTRSRPTPPVNGDYEHHVILIYPYEGHDSLTASRTHLKVESTRLTSKNVVEGNILEGQKSQKNDLPLPIFSRDHQGPYLNADT